MLLFFLLSFFLGCKCRLFNWTTVFFFSCSLGLSDAISVSSSWKKSSRFSLLWRGKGFELPKLLSIVYIFLKLLFILHPVIQIKTSNTKWVFYIKLIFSYCLLIFNRRGGSLTKTAQELKLTLQDVLWVANYTTTHSTYQKLKFSSLTYYPKRRMPKLPLRSNLAYTPDTLVCSISSSYYSLTAYNLCLVDANLGFCVSWSQAMTSELFHRKTPPWHCIGAKNPDGDFPGDWNALMLLASRNQGTFLFELCSSSSSSADGLL